MSSGSGNKMVLAILAAGQSKRFGEQDKLAAELGGKMLGLHVAEALSGLPFDQKIVVTIPDHPCSKGWSDMGYVLLLNDDAEQGQSTSVQKAARSACALKADSLCICLADMPFVTSSHIEQLIAEFMQCEGAQILASSHGKKAMPPAIFPARDFDELMALEGDSGARKLLLNAKTIAATERILMDIDSIADLRRAEQ